MSEKSVSEQNILLESLADEEHRQWAHWVRFLASNGYLKKCDQGLKWLHQAMTDYKDLSEKDKEKDRKFARSTLQIFKEWLQQQKPTNENGPEIFAT